MQASLIVTILILIIVIAVAAFLIVHFSSTQNQTTTSTAQTTINNALTSYTTESTTSTISTISLSTVNPSCSPKNTTSVPLYNGNFTIGYYGWTAYGSGFSNSPLNLSQANSNGNYSGYQWSGASSDYAATTYKQKTSQTPGNLSTNFVVVEPYLNFQVYSPKTNFLYVEIIPLYSGTNIVKYYNTLNGSGTNRVDTFADASINVSSLMCQTVTLRIVSKVGQLNPNLFIAVPRFYQSQSSYQTPGIAANFS